MVASTLFSTILSVGLLGLQVSASPIASSRLRTSLQPIREDDLSSEVFRLNDFQRRSVEDSMDNAIELLPINEDDLIPPHLRKRSDDLSRLDLKENVKMIYGGVVSKSQIYLANMTLYQPDDGHPLIMMERFDGLLKDVYCGTQSITLDFHHKDAMDYAIKTWDWVNEDTEDHFFLIANHPGCGQDAQRNPYKVAKVQYDQETFRTVLTTEAIEWNTLASDFDISLGSANVEKRVTKRELKSSDITKRGFFDIFTNFDFGRSVYWDLTVGDKTTRKTMMSDPFKSYGKVDINCVGCRLSGGLQVTGYVKVVKFAVKELYIGAKPKNLRGTVGLETILRAAIPPGLLRVDATLFSLGIPGLSIPKIFLLGPSLQYEVGAGFGSEGVGNLTVGADVAIPDSAALYADLLDLSKSEANGFEGTTMDPFISLNSVAVTASAMVYSKPLIAFGVKVLDKIGVECALEISLPMLNADFKAGYNKEGFCPDDSKLDNRAVTTGVRASSAANIELWFKAGKYSGIPNILPSFNKKLWGTRLPIGEVCFPIPFGGPGPVIPDEPIPNRPAGTLDAPAENM
ncbi:hypothetical protein TWF225_005859 [Orbilia oligospora]|uniref:Uncharacterized protein n=1 Tax=Orbilia oligospora TaxID=2813651 RepID=A0A7C8PIR4_ORBOL|nr:hypothetical protein TWF751_005069 [Orbilia oligospora]KAF3184959.1 hypothetical protein TWF225_005859 [Orbilia oligospora]KAF3271206.1 hypothetical protein TWF217_005615 [Orbilia oligospora]KAF3271756.1 hypothetical protein TWF128_000300 [Orbilia oligospora]KAF3293656.1 hypothetical protein TWF132_004615 [Orbilia oligospora]